MTAEAVLGILAAVFGTGCAWLLSDRWSQREQVRDLEEEIDLAHGMATKLSYHVLHLDEANRELASFTAVIHELVAILEDTDGSSANFEWLGRQVKNQMLEMLEYGWTFDADLEDGGFRARKDL